MGLWAIDRSYIAQSFGLLQGSRRSASGAVDRALAFGSGTHRSGILPRFVPPRSVYRTHMLSFAHSRAGCRTSGQALFAGRGYILEAGLCFAHT